MLFLLASLTLAIPVWKDKSRPIPERVQALMDDMPLTQRIGQLVMIDGRRSDAVNLFKTQFVGNVDHVMGNQLLPLFNVSHQLGLPPCLFVINSMHGAAFWPGATVFPTELTMACSWNETALEVMANVTALESNYSGISLTLGPVFCISRDTRWGRVGETFGEDPYLIGLYGAAMIRGYKANRFMTCAKHYAGYSESMGGRDATEASLSHRNLLSFFLPAFKKAVDAGVDSLMTSFVALDGTPATANRWLLTEVLKQRWNFSGFIVTDWDSVGDMVVYWKIFANRQAACVAAAKAGLDMVLQTDQYHDAILNAVQSGELDEAAVNDSVRRVLTKKAEYGLFDDERYPDVSKVRAGTPENRQAALEAARQTLTLVKNDGYLPLSANSIKSVAVLGANANHTIAQCGDWTLGDGQGYSGVQPANATITIIQGVRARFPNANVVFVPGAAVEPNEPTDIPAAVAAAQAADVVIVVVGDRPRYWGETKSVATLEFQGTQNELLEAIAALGKKFIIDVVASKPLIIPQDVIDKANAIIFQFSPGNMGGQVLAEAIVGDINPSGHLPITVPRHAGQLPVYYNQIRGQHGSNYADFTQSPQWAFGHGLSYSTFSFSDVKIDKTTYTVGEDIILTFTIWNKGPLAGAQVVQIYIHDVIASVSWPNMELKGHKRVFLAANEQQNIEVRIKTEDCSVVNADAERVVEPGDFELWFGTAASNILLKLPFAIQ
jgi:beta-glucosidase